MTGAGFGGCAVALVDAGYAEEIAKAVGVSYLRESGRKPSI
jgi:galactokinase